MPRRIVVLSFVALVLAGGAAYKHLPSLISRATPATSADDASAGGASAAEVADENDGAFRRVQRPGSVDIGSEYDLQGLTIPQDEIHTLLPRDVIPALTAPKTLAAKDSKWLEDASRVILVEVNQQRYGVPLDILDWHEIVNTTVGGEPIAVTYCPLCDSATVFSRRVTPAGGDGKPIVLEFGVSGALYNSNVLMYDRTHKGLWSQLGMVAISGPLAKTELDMIPVVVVPFSEIRKRWPSTPIVSTQTGHNRPYGRSAYGRYFANDRLMVPVKAHGKDLPAKTLGVGISLEGEAWFVPLKEIGDEGFSIKTPKGMVEIARNAAGVQVKRAPKQAKSAQAFYYAWTAFYPHSEVLGVKQEPSPDP